MVTARFKANSKAFPVIGSFNRGRQIPTGIAGVLTSPDSAYSSPGRGCDGDETGGDADNDSDPAAIVTSPWVPPYLRRVSAEIRER